VSPDGPVSTAVKTHKLVKPPRKIQRVLSGRVPSRTTDRTPRPLWQESLPLLAIVVVVSGLIKAVLIQAFYIPSESMEPGLIKDDRILVEKVSYWGDRTPQRGDVVVFRDPGGWLDGSKSTDPGNALASVVSALGLHPSGRHLVKRVVGVQGDVVRCCDRQGRLRINGEPFEEGAYVKANPTVTCNGPMVTDCGKDWVAGPVPEGKLFVMGDNRARSADSSEHLCQPDDGTECVPGNEFVSTDLVVGKVFAVAWPGTRAGWIRRADSLASVSNDEQP
jgi:signal peptidase I